VYTGYLYFNSSEIGNNDRVTSYLKGYPELGIEGLRNPNMSVAASCGCTNARCLYCDQGSGPDGAYLSPRLDDAPWFDPDAPDSEEFAGFFIEEITGFDSTVRRDFTDGAISGGSLGPLRLAGRCMTVTGWLLARTCCGAEYGLRWLQEALMGNNFCEDCAYGDLYMLKCCPPGEDSCYTSEVGVTDTIPDTNVDFTITDNGSGIYTLVVDDALQANLISDPAGFPNNTEGPIPTCYTAGNSFRFVLADDLGSISTFFIPYEAVTSFVTAPSGSGASTTFTVDTNVEGSCDDVVRQIQRFTSQVTEYFTLHDSGVTIPTNSPTQVRCFETLPGYDPQDYVRLQHRVGLTEGPTVLERMGTCCQGECGCTSLRVEFTLCSEYPHIFSDVDWCIENQTFDLENCYCLDTRKLCNTCTTGDTTKIVQRETQRPQCNINLRHDLTWCAEGWSESDEGCPPEDCELVVGTLEEYVPADNAETTQGTGTLTNNLLVNLNDDLSWSPIGWDPQEGFPPVSANIYPFNGGNCAQPYINDDYLVEQGSAECTFFASIDPFPSYTWTPFLWDPIATGWPPAPCAVSVVPGICECPTTAARPEPPDTDPPTPDPVIDCGFGIWYNPEDCTRGCDPCGDCNTCKPDCGDDGQPNKCPIRLIWNKSNNTYRFEPLTFIGGAGGATGYGDCDCFEITEWAIEGVEPCLVRLYYDEVTGSQTWEPIRWSGDIPAPADCDCIQIAEIIVTRNEESACVNEMDCPINVICDVAYKPDQCTTRQAMAAFFYRYNGSPAYVPPTTPTFPDVGVYNAFYLEIEWANSVGIMTGFGDGTFRPEDGITRQAAAAAYYRDSGSPAFVPPTTPTFSDVPTTSTFYLEIEWCAAELLFFGYPDGTFRPGVCLSRRSAAIVFYRYADVQPTFSDVACTDTFYTEIEWAYDQGIFLGYDDSTFRPDNALLRRIAALTFYREAGSPPYVPPGVPTFLDVPTTDSQYLEIEWVNSVGIMTGFPGPNFMPDIDLSRQGAAVAFYNQNGAPPYVPPAVQTFTDVAPAHPFYLQIEWCASQGIMIGFGDGTFRPNDATTRQAMATFFYRNAGSPAYVPGCYTPTLPPYFIDVPESDPQFQQIEWMHDAGVTFGFTNAKSWEPLGWDFNPSDEFPPLECNFYIATVNGAEQDTSPILEDIEVVYDEFVPDCGPFPSPPPPPTIFSTDCFCEPWEQARECCTFTNPADWNEATTLVEVWTGSEEMRNLKIEAYRNPFGEKVPCPCDPEDDFWECREPCSTILVPQLPARSKLIIDSRQRIAQLVLSSGRVVNALRYIYSGDGKPFEWFDIGQCSTFCIVVQADCRQTAADAEVSVGAVGRYTASGW
jgi:hypothetical protein